MARSRSPAAAVGQWAVLLLPAAALGWFGWARRWVSDDAFIDLRVVQHLLAGYGPVFNAGERVEAYTSPLWLGLLAAGGALARWPGGNVPLEWPAVIMGLGCAVFGVAAAIAGAALAARHAGRTGLALPLGALLVVAVPAYWDFATSGLETGLALGWLGVCYWWLSALLAHRPAAPFRGLGQPDRAATASGVLPPEQERSPGSQAGRGIWAAAALVGLGPLVRPDLAVISAGLVVLLLAALPSWRWRRVAGLLVACGLLPALYQVFRMGYFAAVVPNTALAKEAGAVRWDQGWRYFADFAGPYWLWIPLLPLGAWWLFDVGARLARRNWRGAALAGVPVAAGALHGLYVVRVGGDFMHARMLLPSLFTVLLPVVVVAGARWWHALLPALVVVPWAAAAMLWLRPPYYAVGNGVGPQGIADERTFYVWFSHHPHPVTLADYSAADWKQVGDDLRERAAHERALLVGADLAPEEGGNAPRTLPLAAWVPEDAAADRRSTGLVGYAAGLRVRVVDRFGLADPIGGRLRLEQRARPGHEKIMPEAWVIARYAAPEDLPAAAAVSSVSMDVEAAQAALRCGDLATLLDAIQQPLTVSRFQQNVPLAWRLSALRLPKEPPRARTEQCGA